MDLPENTAKQDEVEEEQYHTVMDYLPDWAKGALTRAHCVRPGAPNDPEQLSDDVRALCSALAAALRQVQTGSENCTSLVLFAVDMYKSMVEQAVRDEREACAVAALQSTSGPGAHIAAEAIRARDMINTDLSGNIEEWKPGDVVELGGIPMKLVKRLS